MRDSLYPAVRAVAKGSGWSVKRDTLVKRLDGSALAVHPRHGSKGIIEFRAKPVAWDQLLWSILQIRGNEKQPASFHFWGVFTCDTPALAQMAVAETDENSAIAEKMRTLAIRCESESSLWNGYDLDKAIKAETPDEPYRYHMTRVVERICKGDRTTAGIICQQANAGQLDIRRTFSATDNERPPDARGGRPSMTFFELAQVWMSRN
ncbi:hypothetical protein [Agrobacterium sp.]|uniref:hypothetical protein n=1 Tax=Agrobacterium sp. TaxID=361 RepID=UPI0028A6F90F|nr:hypothetical protein [Agrobacterium sp.]